MANITVTKQVIQNGRQNYVATYSLVFDGSGTLVDYLAADPTAAGDMGFAVAGNTRYPLTALKIRQINYNLPPGFSVRVRWDATTKQDAWVLYGFGKQDFLKQGPLFVPQSNGAPITGATGKILFSSYPETAPAATLAGSIMLWLHKDTAL